MDPGSWPTKRNPFSVPVGFKNVQVLKDVPPLGMQFISALLGVKCELCHVRDAFDTGDNPPKKKASQR